MSTRDPDPGLTGFEALERLAAAAAGAPDAGLIARIANELFTGGFPAPGAAPSLPTAPAVAPVSPATSPLSFATASPPSLPATPAGVPSPETAPGATGGSPTVMPTAAELSLVPEAHVGVMADIPGLGSPPTVSPPSAPAAASLPAGAPFEPGLPVAVPTTAQLSAIPGAHPTRAVPDFETPASGARAGVPANLPGEGALPADEVKAAAAPAQGGTRVEVLELPRESVTYDPGRVPDLGLGVRQFDPAAVRREFPILDEKVHGKRLIWLDNAATTQKPNAVIDRLSDFYRHENSNIHRAAHALAARATDAYEAAREKVRRFLNAGSTREIVFVRGTTEGVNLVAQTFGRRNVGEGDEIVITHLEHHANIVPWQMLCAEKKARLRVAPVNDRGEVILEEYEKLLGPRTRLVSVTQVSNALGTVVPVQAMTEMAHRHGIRVLVDAAQSVSHMSVDVQTIGCDFLVFSGHKVFGPTGIGAVFGRTDLLDATPPWQGGGNMIADVTFEKTVYQPAPFKFEAGTGNIADAVGLGAALDWVLQLGRENIARHEHALLQYMTEGLLTVHGLTIIGTAAEKAGVVSFVLDGMRTEDVGAALDQEGIAVRSGHHCAQPILRRFGLEGTVRPSLAPYNTCEDVDTLVAALHRIQAGRGGLTR